MTIVNTDNDDFLKDLSTGALINTNKGALDKYRKAKEQSAKVAALECELQNIKSELVHEYPILRQFGEH